MHQPITARADKVSEVAVEYVPGLCRVRRVELLPKTSVYDT